MQIINALAQTFHATPFDVFFFLCAFGVLFAAYYFVPLRVMYEVAFGGIVGLGVYVLLSVLLLGNIPLGTQGGLLPMNFSIFIISAIVYLVILLPIIFPIQGGLVLAETTNPVLYTIQYLVLGSFLILSFFAIVVYMIEQRYIFQIGTVFIWLRDWDWYQSSVRTSKIFQFIIEKQNFIIPLAVLLMIYKLFLSNLISAIVMTVAYNLMNVGFYKKKDASSYRVEFHEVGGGEHSEAAHGEGEHHDDGHH